MSTHRTIPSQFSLPVTGRRLLMAFGDLVAVNLAVVAALRIWTIVGDRAFDWAFIWAQAYWFLAMSGLWLLLAAANDFYNLSLSTRWLDAQGRLFAIELQLLLIYLIIFFLSPRDALPRLFVLYYAALSYALVALWRGLWPVLTGWEGLRQRVLIVGTGWSAQTIIHAIRTWAPNDYEIVGVVDEKSSYDPGGIVVDAEVIGYRADLTRIVEELAPHEIVLATSEEVDGLLFQALMDCYEMGVPIQFMPILYEQLTNMVPVEYARGHWNLLLPLAGNAPFDPYPVVKRGVDIALSAVGLAVFGVMLPFVALAITLDSPGPIFYRQERVGKAGRIFQIAKLRTMIPDAERLSGPTWAQEDDPRITRVGRFLRRSRLDEAPQLLNILEGEMSLIGPRPEREHYVQQLQESIPFYRTRLAVRPGVTGWAQVNYGYGSTTEDQLNKLKYDLYYIRHRSLVLDAVILLRTVGRVVRLGGR
jgi:exopolysaccharide biosynthesis polyprenyl glycosylphosphotransferase